MSEALGVLCGAGLWLVWPGRPGEGSCLAQVWACRPGYLKPQPLGSADSLLQQLRAEEAREVEETPRQTELPVALEAWVS